MPDENEILQVTGMQEALNELSFLDSLGINNDYLVPSMRSLGAQIKPIERQNIPVFSGQTGKSLTSKVSQNGIGSVTLTLGPNKSHILPFRVISGGAQWHDRTSPVHSTAERKRNARIKGGGGDPSYLPAANLVAWVTAKLGATSNALQVAFAVAKSIGRNGLKAHPIVPPTVEEISNLVVTTISSTISRMVEEIHSHDND